MKYNLKWTNIYSNETGYVGSVSKKKGYFVNASAKADAKTYISAKTAEKDIALLEELGEAENNHFEIEVA